MRLITTEIAPDDIVCLECGEILKGLEGHLRKHRVKAAEYKQRWGYNLGTGLRPVNRAKEAARVARKKHMGRRLWPREKTQVRTSLQKAHAALRSRPHSLEARLDKSDRQRGMSYPDRQVVRDWAIGQRAFQGKRPSEIAAQLGSNYAQAPKQKKRTLTCGAVSMRCKRMGLPSFRAGAWIVNRGEVLASRHLLETCQDFNLTGSELADQMGAPRQYISRRLRHSAQDFPLPAKWARALLEVREQLKLERSREAPTPQGGRPRTLLPSGKRLIQRQAHQLVVDLCRLRRWVKESTDGSSGGQSLKLVWNWTCTEHRKGRIKVLLFLQQSLFGWLRQKCRTGYYLHERDLARVKPTAYGFLAGLHGISEAMIDWLAWPRSSARKPAE